MKNCDSYPKPKENGGQLIRTMIAHLRACREPLPDLNSHILLAVSGGPDSVAMLILAVKYGRRVAPMRAFSAIHINHQWRGQASERDARFVASLCKKLGVPLRTIRVPPPDPKIGESPENDARKKRYEALESAAIECERTTHQPVLIWTAHTEDDLFETLVWRAFTGAIQTHGLGILSKHGRLRRPFLSVSRKRIEGFLKEEDINARKDKTNENARYLRARLRRELVPKILEHFPRAKSHWVKAALSAQYHGVSPIQHGAPSSSVHVNNGPRPYAQRLRRAHIESMAGGSELVRRALALDLPGGLRLPHSKSELKKRTSPAAKQQKT